MKKMQKQLNQLMLFYNQSLKITARDKNQEDIKINILQDEENQDLISYQHIE